MPRITKSTKTDGKCDVYFTEDGEPIWVMVRSSSKKKVEELKPSLRAPAYLRRQKK